MAVQNPGSDRSAAGIARLVRAATCCALFSLCATAAAQTGASGPPLILGVVAALVLAVLAYWLGRRSRRHRRYYGERREPQFSRKAELVDELDTENMELTEKVRGLTAELEAARREAQATSQSLKKHDDELADIEESGQRKFAAASARVQELESDIARLRSDLAKQEARRETLEARLAEAPVSRQARSLPPGHEELDGKLALEDTALDDETTVARLNRKLVLARNTIAEFLESQQQLDDADARAAMEGDTDPRHLDESQLRAEITRLRRQVARLTSEMHMQVDVIRALEGDAVELKRVESQLEDKSTTAVFLQNELASMIEEVAQLKGQLAKRRPDPADDDEDVDPKLLQAMSRSSKG